MNKILPLTLLALALSSSSFAEITPQTESFAGDLLKYPVISLPKKGVAEKLNKQIAASVEKLKKQHSSRNGHADHISMSYEVLLETSTRLNLLLYSWTYNNGAAHGSYYTEGLSYDLTDGKRLTPEKYIGLPTASQIDSGIREGRYQLTGADNKPLDLTDFWKVEYVAKEGLLNADNSLTLVYQIYDLAPYAMGNTFVTIPKEHFAELSGKEVKLMSDKQAAEASEKQAKLAAKEAEKQAKAAEKAELAQIKAEQKAAMEKLKAEQKTQLEAHKAKHAKPKTAVK